MLTFLALAAASPCPVERAHYVLRDDAGVTARFHSIRTEPAWPGGLALAVRIARSGRTYWLLPADGGTRDRPFAKLARGPGSPPGGLAGSTDFLHTDESYRFLRPVPRRGDPAPAHLLLPHFGREIWYASDRSDERDAFPRSFFDLVGCGADAPEPDVELPSAG